MKILVAPDKFKQALDASRAAAAIAAGLRDANPQIELDECPLADGGDGTGRLLAGLRGAQERSTRVHGPLGEEHAARWWYDAEGRAAIIELAEAAGLHGLPDEQRDALRATTRGVGELVITARQAGARHVTLAVGGSATVDGGAGCLQALGWVLLDERGRALPVGIGGGDLDQVRGLRGPHELPDLDLKILADVDNPLVGPRGAAPVFAPQKGALPEHVAQLARNLEHWAAILATYTGRDVSQLPGGGAAGGIAAGLVAALGARLRPGFDEIAQRVQLAQRIAEVDFVLTGEGRIDDQTAGGKVVGGVLRLAQRSGVPVVALCGAWQGDEVDSPNELAQRLGLQRLVIITPPDTPTAQALADTEGNLRVAAADWLRGQMPRA